jgi:uncharacterized repeat protein (TIGR03803 family)
MNSQSDCRRALLVVAATLAALLAAKAAPAQATFTTLVNFAWTNGADPLAGLAQGLDGNLYGTTFYGGEFYQYAGTIFKVTPTGSLTTLYSFCAQTNCADGDNPWAGLVLGPDGSFYGTTYFAGASYAGTIFKITPKETFTSMDSFDSSDGADPLAGLILATDGNFYGTTSAGGANSSGTVFRVTPTGTLTTIYSFCAEANCADGANPTGNLVQASDGNFYGTTFGTVFKITPAGVLTTLHTFCTEKNCPDGDRATGGLVQAADGDFYGTTFAGGFSDHGTIFKIDPGGTLTTLHRFCVQSSCSDGYGPEAGLVQATDGNFYGTTSEGGAYGVGTVFRMTSGGSLTTLHPFDGTDGSYPAASVVQGTNGAFYGTTYLGGANGAGTVFSLSVGLGPFVASVPTSGKVGTTIKILGTNLTDATSVTFNGTAATFTVESSSYIRTTVPAGATTGTVQVVTPSSTLSSNVPFRVVPPAGAFLKR